MAPVQPQVFWDSKGAPDNNSNNQEVSPSTIYTDTPRAVVARTIVELAVGFLTVDDVEAVRDGSLHAAHLEVEPLLVLGAVYVSVDQQVILKPVESEARANGGAALRKQKRCYFCLLHAHSPILDPRSMTFVLGFLSL